MPKRIAPLTDTKIRTAKPTEKPQKLFDGGGLFLLITPTGGKLWRFKYRFGGNEKLLSMGTYPGTSLAEASCVCQVLQIGLGIRFFLNAAEPPGEAAAGRREWALNGSSEAARSGVLTRPGSAAVSCALSEAPC
jgi:hypothetical protein